MKHKNSLFIYQQTSSVRKMECPHCTKSIAATFYLTRILPYIPGKNCRVISAICPSCKERIIYNEFTESASYGGINTMETEDFEKWQAKTTLVFPRRKKPKTLSLDIPSDYRQEYEEAYAIINDSPKASAALSRRLLQKLLEDKGNVKKGDLSNQIQQVIDSKQLHTDTANCIDAVRNIGNFAAHPLKSQASGQIIDVEPGEADWNLETLELLFDHYFVKPAEIKRKQNALNQKLQSFGKPPMKTSGP